MRGQSFLLVDDDPIALKDLEKILLKIGYQDIEATDNANQAWLMVRMRDYSCVISAFEMPEMNGLALLKIIRNDDKLYNMLFFLTHSTFTEIKVIQAGQSGVTGLIVKPFDAKTIENKLNAIPEITSQIHITEAENLLQEGLRFIEANDYENALRIFRELTHTYESAEAYYNIGYIKTAQKKYEEAILAFRKATQLDSLFAKAYDGMGQAYKQLGRNEEAQECFQIAVDIYLEKESIQDAEEVLNEILQINPDSVNVFNSLGVLYRKKGDLRTALVYYQKARNVHPNEPRIYYNIARLYIEMDRHKDAKSYFERSLGLDPDFQEAKDVLKAIELGTVRELR